MIDLKKAEMEFEKYTSNYDKNNTKIAFFIQYDTYLIIYVIFFDKAEFDHIYCFL